MYNPQIETFIQVADAGSFHKASKKLHVTATAVIKQINLLETELNLKLFVRTHRGLLLTEAGKSLYQDVKYIIQYSRESIVRAKNAEKREEQIVRIGVSPMTPVNLLAELWPKIHKICPELKYEYVTFANTPEIAREGLRNLGKHIDIVAGLYDENFLKAAGCAVLHLSAQPVRCGVSIRHRLAGRKSLTFHDLEGEKLMMIYRGWNCELDKLRNELQLNYPKIMIEDFHFFDMEVFNRCENSNDIIVACDLWQQAHPLIRVLPVEWDYGMDYGLFHAPEPSEPAQHFLDAVESIMKSDNGI